MTHRDICDTQEPNHRGVTRRPWTAARQPCAPNYDQDQFFRNGYTRPGLSFGISRSLQRHPGADELDGVLRDTAAEPHW